MKKIYLLALLAIPLITIAQGVVISTASSATPNPDALLDLQSTTQGFLPPRMDSIQLVQLGQNGPLPQGLIVFNTTSNSLSVYNGITWVNAAHYIGENYGGGIVFYVYDGGQHGLIAATTNQSDSMRWYAGTYTNTMAYTGESSFYGSLPNGIDAGKSNTELIIASQAYGDGGTYAARVCHEYSVTIDSVTYEDWYLPSVDELKLLYLQVAAGKVVANGYQYWSSTEVPALNGTGIAPVANTAFLLNFNDGGTIQEDLKNSYYFVRAIRSF